MQGKEVQDPINHVDPLGNSAGLLRDNSVPFQPRTIIDHGVVSYFHFLFALFSDSIMGGCKIRKLKL